MNLPLWLFIVLTMLSLIAILDRVLMPSLRWFLRRRINRVIDEINTRLDIEIKPIQLTKRQILIDRLAHDPKVQNAVQEFAREKNIPIDIVNQKAWRYAKEIVPSFNAYVYFRVGYWLAKKVAKLLYRVRVSFSDENRLAGIDVNATVVFVINHRSNMDYVLVSFLAAENTTLSYAVGEWAKIWPLRSLIKAMGAFFVRRNSGNPLYRRVLERYIHMATQEGVCQAVFLEGGLSRDGNFRQPRLGILDYMLRDHDINSNRDIVFVPVGLNYDRTLEDRTLLQSLNPEKPKHNRWYVVRTIFGFIWHNIKLMVGDRWHRFGFACVHFGEPVSICSYCEQQHVRFNQLKTEQRFHKITHLADSLMVDISKIVPVLPVPLVAFVLLDSEKNLNQLEFFAKAHNFLQHLEQQGAIIAFPPRTRTFALQTALKMLEIRHLVQENDGIIEVADNSEQLLSYYANSIKHWLNYDKTNLDKLKIANT